MKEDCFHLGIKALIRNRNREILLLKVNQRNLKSFKGKSYWDIPGGRIQKGSTIEETLKREVKEETGIDTITSFTPLSMVLSNIRIPLGEHEDVGLILSIYICEVEGNFDIKLSEEHNSFDWFSPRQAAELLKVKYPLEFTECVSRLE